ncbi:MAG TPA: protease inhibitor I42 family protein [Methanoregulaceae archaeon]|jgi:inhibitor of cysteine peptidase|nr:protease inhibitor I42 family protein [Methanoregulaceae archaeon]HNO09162.1 protease inhibitor I42 family protein [Methanoregulaceae archaeon]HNW79856.1 protease inhibitor I42 family protein [Methanoregulaceae archaeon]HPS23626.1 protease inhibitor I42 family protein [Methanoregulaceae archaeon]
MTTDSWKKQKSIVILSVLVMLGAMLLLSGCTTQPAGTPTATPTATPMPTTAVPTTTVPINMTDFDVYNETANNTTATIPLGSGGLMVRLIENPSTGYSWNATVTSGLTIVDDAFEQNPASQGMAGAPGTHYWILSGTAAGQQKFSAIYMRPWENVTGTEDTFVLNILVE